MISAISWVCERFAGRLPAPFKLSLVPRKLLVERLISVLITLIIACSAGAELARANELLSLRGIELTKGSFISGFHIETFGVRIIAVCRFPGWTIAAGNSIDLSGTLDGNSGGGVANLDGPNAYRLDDLFLVDVIGYQQEERRKQGEINPASFSGMVSIGTYGDDDKTREIKLHPDNFVRCPASQCPYP
jgi:hypothetical protein